MNCVSNKFFSENGVMVGPEKKLP